MIRPPSSMVGATPLGFILRYQGWSLPPKAPPTSSRSYFTPHSSAAHSTFITLIELARPQIFITFLLNRHPERSRGASFSSATKEVPPRRALGASVGMTELASVCRRPGGADAGVDDQRHRELGRTLHHLAGDRFRLVDFL